MSGGIAQYRATSGEGTFPGQGGASKNRRSMAHKRDPLGAHEKQTRGLRGTPRSMSILWKRGRFLDRGAPRQHRGSVVHKEDPIGAHERAKGAKRDLQINVYIMGEWMFPGQGGASKNRWSMVHKRDLGSGAPRKIEGQCPTRGTPLGPMRESQGALRDTLKSMSMLWAMECVSWARGRLE